MNYLSQLLFVATTLSLPTAISRQEPATKTFAFTHVAVIDVVNGRATPDMTVIVSDRRITAVGKSGTLRPPTEAEVINANGKFLIPGLWDMHVHLYSDLKDHLQLFLANGVTGVRQMSGNPIAYEWRAAVQNETLVGPRIVVASRVMDGAKAASPTNLVVHDAVEAREAVQGAKHDGADFIKVYNWLPREAFFAIADEARKDGLPFVGHVPISVSTPEASDAGIKSIEHLRGVLEGSSSREGELRRLMQDLPPGTLRNEAGRRVQHFLRDTLNQSTQEALLKRLQQNHTWQTPTTTLLYVDAFPDQAAAQAEPRLKYLPAELKSDWQGYSDWLRQLTIPEGVELAKWRYQRELEVIGRMGRTGVELLAGIDVGNPFLIPGFSLHDELSLLVKAGLSPAEALRSATINPARFLGRDAELGTIATGKLADLVLLDANPLQDIRNTTRINAVVVNGRVFDRTTLDDMLTKVQNAASLQKPVK
jgi:hypothetical protein